MISSTKNLAISLKTAQVTFHRAALTFTGWHEKEHPTWPVVASLVNVAISILSTARGVSIDLDSTLMTMGRACVLAIAQSQDGLVCMLSNI